MYRPRFMHIFKACYQFMYIRTINCWKTYIYDCILKLQWHHRFCERPKYQNLWLVLVVRKCICASGSCELYWVISLSTWFLFSSWYSWWLPFICTFVMSIHIGHVMAILSWNQAFLSVASIKLPDVNNVLAKIYSSSTSSQPNRLSAFTWCLDQLYSCVIHLWCTKC